MTLKSIRLRHPCALRVLLFTLAAASVACGPQGPLGVVPGGPLGGELISEPLADWRFTDDVLTVAIETQGDWINHSVTVMAAAVDRVLYIPSRQGYRKQWVQNIERDPRVRIGVDNRIYEGRASRVQDPVEAERAARAQLRKYLGLDFDEVRPLLDAPAAGDDRIEVWFFRIESVSEATS